MTKTQKGAMSGNDLGELLKASQKKVAESAAKTVETSRSAKQEKVDTDNKSRKVDDAKNVLTKRGVVQKRFWAILQLTTGKYVLEEAESKRNEMPSVADMLAEKAVLGKYNPNHIISIVPYRTVAEAEKAAQAIRKEREIELKEEAKAKK